MGAGLLAGSGLVTDKWMGGQGHPLIRFHHSRSLLKEILTKYADLIRQNPEEGRETELIFGEERDHYLLVHNGLEADSRSGV